MTRSADNNAGHMPLHRSHPATRQVQSFGRRKGRKLRAAQQRLIDELLPALRIDLSEPLIPAASSASAKQTPGQDRIWLDAMFGSAPPGQNAPRPNASGPNPPDRAHQPRPRSAKPIWLEIGFGGGEHFIWQAAQNPDINFIGCEPFLDGVVKVLRAIENEGLHNIRLYDDDARDLLRRLPDATIQRVFILFPDPWPKKRQQKRRLVSPATLDLLARVMKPGAELRIGTDIADYARAILLSVLRHTAFQWPAMSADDWRLRPPDWPETRYEQKARAEGRSCSYFHFQRRLGDW